MLEAATTPEAAALVELAPYLGSSDLFVRIAGLVHRLCGAERVSLSRGDTVLANWPSAGAEPVAGARLELPRSGCRIEVVPASTSIQEVLSFLRWVDLAVASDRQLEPPATPLTTQETIELVQALELAMHTKDPLTGGHARAVGVYAFLVARAMDLAPERQRLVFYAGLLHDVGKLAIPDHILKKEGPLDDEEWEFMRRHPVIAAGMIERLHGLLPLHDPILYHHERLDGRGYPLGLPSERIPLEARIISVVDAYDAMTRQRCYTRTRPHAEAVAELYRCAGTQFDTAIVDIFVGLDLPDPLTTSLESLLG